MWNLITNVLYCYALMGTVTFSMFYIDKRAARLGQKRIPELWLMVSSLLFGWIGGILAMKYIRHKNRKVSFIIKMVIAVTTNFVVIGMMVKAIQ